MRNAHPALQAVLEEPKSAPRSECDSDSVSPEQPTVACAGRRPSTD